MTAPQAAQPPELITLPIMLVALLRFSDIGVQLHRARGGSSIWRFRFSPGGVLEVGDDGHWLWRRGSERWRRQIAPFLTRAEAMLQEAYLPVPLRPEEGAVPSTGSDISRRRSDRRVNMKLNRCSVVDRHD